MPVLIFLRALLKSNPAAIIAGTLAAGLAIALLWTIYTKRGVELELVELKAATAIQSEAVSRLGLEAAANQKRGAVALRKAQETQATTEAQVVALLNRQVHKDPVEACKAADRSLLEVR